ncbi:hypothetical protein SYK_13210 [Pseudodesulfovibrio nedwellii]|uniref:Uncharacterized protein n=1 Tax=Pseudodesulfovibrio nedwellii TaxID=2973072 RepID=A0ABN6S4N0_9BACT|nr:MULTISPECIES: hypothetical protein [Pseudodesulfovibrio]BDQ36961.1 hypothetical protein SYK_13210 [Pseudodesulfovibrio nedwellii]
MPKNSLILGLAAGYHYGDVRPFLASLDQVDYSGDRILFVSDTTRNLDQMQSHSVTTIPIKRTTGHEKVPYNGLRYFSYLNFLESSKRYDHILIADVRDVVFQRDPFSFPWAKGLNCTLEDRSATIGGCPYNAHWVREHLGPEMLTTLTDKPVSCSGTTVGDHDAMVGYLRTMTSHLTPPPTAKRMAGYDQAIHNMLVHTGQIETLTLLDNSGPILTLGQTQGEPTADDTGNVLNEAGTPAHIVHQYDRKPILFKTIRGLYAA